MDVENYSTREASRILRVSMRRVHQLLEAGDLEGEKDTAGRWRIPQRAVHAVLAERPDRDRGDHLDNGSVEARNATQEATELREVVRELERQLGRLEGRLELTEVAESTMREQLERERDRADRLEVRANNLEEELRAARRSWWRRFFGV